MQLAIIIHEEAMAKSEMPQFLKDWRAVTKAPVVNNEQQPGMKTFNRRSLEQLLYIGKDMCGHMAKKYGDSALPLYPNKDKGLYALNRLKLRD